MNRTSTIQRKTNETDIKLTLKLDGTGNANLETGLGFFDHMLNTLAKHSSMDIDLKVIGDLHVDDHHTMEDVGICLGQALNKALGNKKGIQRFGTAYCPLDESLARTVIDLSGRAHFEWQVPTQLHKVGDVQTESFPEFFKSFTSNGMMNVHMDLIRGENLHHIIEALFKSFAQALKQAVKQNESGSIPSTKGSL